eukprot:TRINITY_DN23496_c0_g1_i1.p1 TRINITY_DN23496_c0_g1~~TRINITY_DN23496_c0_g1_i1.p1  ORF type:complete len:638 (-),score=121.43 TRINITY_DN23496_c0_g1_i1:160-2073(-)
MRTARSNSASGAHGHREPSRDRDVGVTSSSHGVGRQSGRPSSARPARGGGRHSAPSRGHAAADGTGGGAGLGSGVSRVLGISESEQNFRALQHECFQLKCAANGIEKETTKTRTRLMALERELQKRDRLLRQLMAHSKAGQGIGKDLVEKLREERNLLPILKRKAQDLQAQIEEKDIEFRSMKRDPMFTRIIELQVEYASWQHEMRRLEGLLNEPSVELNDAARREVDVHEQRVANLEQDAADIEAKRSEVISELNTVEEEWEDCQKEYEEGEQNLKRQQDSTRDTAVSFKALLQERREAEQLESEIEQLSLHKRQYVEELGTFKSAEPASDTSVRLGGPPLGRRFVSKNVLTSTLELPFTPSVTSSFRAMRVAAANCGGEESVFARLVAADDKVGGSGLLSQGELASVLADVLDGGGGARPPLPSSVAAVVATAAATGGLPGADEEGRIRWLDFLVTLDRLNSKTIGLNSSAMPPPLPDIRPLRAACLRSCMSAEVLRQRLCEVNGASEMEAFVADLGVPEAKAWADAWEAHGGIAGLLLRLPLWEAALPDVELRAWLARCTDAVKAHRRELDESFVVWRADMFMLEAQFNMVCTDVLGVELSQEDVDDLGLLAGVGEGDCMMVDGSKVLLLGDVR